jgi:hypothetical protein
MVIPTRRLGWNSVTSGFLAVLLLSLVALTPAEDSSPRLQKRGNSDVLVLKKTVRRVIVDVVVRDKDRKPVNGLTAKDFAVEEDGKPQRLLSFEPHQLDAASIAIPPSAPALPPNVFATSLRIAVRNTATDRLGALEIPLLLNAQPEVSANPGRIAASSW